MHDHEHSYIGPSGITFNEEELRALFVMLNGQASPLRDALAQRINGYLIYMDATRLVQIQSKYPK